VGFHYEFGYGQVTIEIIIPSNPSEQPGVWSYSLGIWGNFFDTTEQVDYFIR